MAQASPRQAWILYWLLCFLCLHSISSREVLVSAANEECGKQAGGVSCPLNVCCSEWGFCGTAPDFCATSKNCQSNCGADFKPSTPWGYDARNTIIGYFESWAPTNKGCGRKTATDIPLGSLTHINTAFGYIQPDTYTIYPIDGIDVEYFKAVTNVKTNAPATKVWLSLGGWTFSDNDTTTQPVWSDLSSTQEKRDKFISGLDKFMTQWGFDGVDLDWEYPAAPDRRGKREDTKNYLALMQDIKTHFDGKGLGWGLSFTAPASYWYMKWFDIAGMAEVVDFVNLMTYDMHGSWDDRSDWIGPHIYSHTNMTEIKDGLQLLWRNNVPADKVNLGLAFYGRSYTLADADCATPGCKFKDPGIPGLCTGTGGYLSYAEIKDLLESTGAKPVHDKETMSKYVRFNNDQWVSFDDPETIKQKVDYANSIGLRGLFIWAIDQDTSDHEMMAAVLGDKGLGYFGGVSGGSDWSSQMRSGCEWSNCGTLCNVGQQRVTSVRCPDGDGKARKQLCCPLDGAPDPDFCTWRSNGFWTIVGCSVGVDNPCGSDEVLITKDNYYVDSKGNDASCLGIGQASYCCKREETGEKLCEWAADTCITLKDGKPDGSNGCDQGQQLVTYRKADCGSAKVQPFCCSSGVDAGKLACHWGVGSSPNCASGKCGQSEVNLGSHEGGGGVSTCRVPPPKYRQRDCPDCLGWQDVYPTLCCNKDALRVDVKTLPVPLENIFFPEDLKSLPADSKADFSILTDGTMGGQNSGGGNSDPNSNSFAWHIIDGPTKEVTSLDKRDGSHWDMYGCDTESHEGQQKAKMVCTDGSTDSNCDLIWLGEVAATVIKMPKGCGPGKYAMAVSLTPTDGQPPPHVNIRNTRRGAKNPTVYELTFDYDFSILQKRGSNALLRIDYSDNPGYWSEIVSAPAKSKRQIQDEVDVDHGGDWHSFLDHHWNLQRRATPDHKLHILHERWFSIELDDWIQRMRHVEVEYTALRHSIRDTYVVPLFDEEKVCQIGPVTQTLRAKLTASMNINIETSAQLTIMGNLGDLSSFKQSHMTLRNKGSLSVLVDFQAFAELRFGSLNNELAGFAPLGASIVIPGIVTIGPQFKLKGGLQGRIEAHANTQLQVTVAEWDFAQSYPYKGDKPYDADDLNIEKDGSGSARQGISNKTLGAEWTWDVEVSGSVEIHVIPQFTFGVTWNEKLKVPNAAIDFGVDTYGRLYGEIGATSGSNGVSYCYGMDVGYEVYVRATAPTLFPGLPNLNRYWPITGKEVPLVKSKENCGSGSSKRDLLNDQIPAGWMGQSVGISPNQDAGLLGLSMPVEGKR